MKRGLRILHLEDNPDYADLVKSMLAKEGIRAEFTVAQSAKEFEELLENVDFDLILADYLLPGYDGIQALNRTLELRPETPFLLVSGTIGEQAAIESLKAGATDYVLKQWPDRLVPAIKRALQERQERARRQEMESQLHNREKYFRAVTENALDVVTILNAEGGFLYNSPSIAGVLGYSPEEMAGKSAFDLVHPEDLPRVAQAFNEALNHNHSVRLEFRCRHADGSWRHLEVVGQNRLSDPDIAGLVINSRDITDRKQAEQEVRDSELQYRLLFAENPNPMWIFDHETLAFLEVNGAAVEHYGYSREEFLSMTLPDLRYDQELPIVLEYMHQLQTPGQPPKEALAGSWRHRKKDGSAIEVEVKWSPIRFKGRLASLAMVTDVTERNRIQHRDATLSQLGQSLSSARTPIEAAQIIQAVGDELFQWDAFTLNLYSADTGHVHPVLNVDTDRQGQRFEIRPKSGLMQISPFAKRVVQKGAELVLREEPVKISPDCTPIGDTSRASASLMMVPIRNGTKVIGLLSIQSYTLKAYDQQDLNILQTLADHCGGALERMRAEQALRESEQRFRDLFEGSPDAIFVEDINGTVLDVNPAACELHGMTRQQLIGKHVTELVPPEARPQVVANFAALVEHRITRLEASSWTTDRRTVPVEVRANRIEYAGNPAMLLHVRDITERKQAEAALTSSELLFHSVWENSVDGMRLSDENGQVVAVNEAYCKQVAMQRGELEGQLFTAVFAQPNENAVWQNYRERFARRLAEKQAERILKLRNGNLVTFEVSSSFVDRRGERPLLLELFRDVTMQKRLQEELRQSQKLEAIGQLAGGVAHDFNNILTVIHGHASLLTRSAPGSTLVARSAEQIVQAAERAAGLTRQLLTFSRRQVLQPRPLNLNEVVANMTKMLARILGEDVGLQVHYSSQPALVRADAGMLEQVLLNLAVNSRDAMPKGGQLALKILVRDIRSAETPQDSEARPGRFVCLSVSDTGCGIPPENLPRIFEPFFTTKQVGKGTGLGLATVYGIVKQHQGWIDVQSQLNHGTTFEVFIPYVPHPSDGPPDPPVTKPVRGGTETILVVEDEAPVRQLACDLLTRHGYQILQAESGAKALELWERCKDQVDLVLTDLVMPDYIDGRELAQRLWSERPKLKVIFTSGYSAEVVGKDFVLQRDLNYLQKPYPPERLAIAVRECLDAVN